MVKNLSTLIVLIIALSMIVAPIMAQDGGDDDTPPQQSGSLADTLVAVSEEEGEFTLFVEALEETAFDVTLHTGGPFTVFAPTDAAITAYLRAQGIAPPEFLENIELVTQVLQYHVIAGRFLSRNIVEYSGGALATTLPGTALDVTMIGDTLYINESRVVGTDIVASNGVIFTVDSILLPPDSGIVVNESVEADDSSTGLEDNGDTPQPLFTLNVLTEQETLEGFVQAIQSSPIATELVNASGPYTIFAPTDEGFGGALEILGISGNDLIADTDRLNTTLFYHVIPMQLTTENLQDLDDVYIGTIAAGLAVRVNVIDGEIYINRGRIGNDLIASNAQIYIVDFLLLDSDNRLTAKDIQTLDDDSAEDSDETESSDENTSEDESDENADEQDVEDSTSDEDATEDNADSDAENNDDAASTENDADAVEESEE